MRSTHILAAAAGLAALAGPLATTAAAQMSPNGWIIQVQDPILAPAGHSSGLPQSTTIEVYAKFDSAVDYAFAAGLFDLVANEHGDLGVTWTDPMRVAPFDFPPGTPADDGRPETNGASRAKPGQLHFPAIGTIGDDSNPALVWTIEYNATDFRSRFIDLETITDPGAKGFALFDDEFAGTSRRIDASLLMEGMGQIQIIPAPGALACLGLAGLTLVRRRR